MPGALLRSGPLQEFKSLGEDGQPVYTSALQLREAIRLKLGREAAHCLAIPQRNETGDHIDWYAPEAGDVVPWSAATDDERMQAKAQLQDMHTRLLGVSQTMRGEQNRERQIFGRLLEKVIFFPDDSHVYLVNGKPVLTFWGFTDPHGSSSDDPLGRLQPRAPQPVAHDVTAVPSRTPDPLPPVVPVAKKRFPWWWLLLIPLLLLLLFFLLRSCAPEMPLPFIAPDVTEQPPVEEIRNGVRYDADGNVISTGTGVSESATTGEALPPAEGEAAPEVPPEETASEETAPEEKAPEEPAPDLQPEEPPVPEEQAGEEPKPEEPAPEAPPAEAPQPDEPPAPEPKPEEPQPENKPQPAPPELQNPQTPPGQKPPGQSPQKPLEIPADAAKSGKTDFLDGKWKAGAGIQDARTGKPMRLDYDFKDGKGQVNISGNGVECVGDVNTAVGAGGLTIDNSGPAKCKDGSTYKLPKVTCKPGATSAADCTGQYDNSNKFPMSIKQGG